MKADIEALKRIAKKAEPLLANCEGHLNHPLRNRDGKRVVGFVLPENIAGLSDGLFMVEAVQQLAKAVPALLSELASLRSEREGVREGLKIATDTLAIMGEELAPVLPKTSTQANKVATRLRALLHRGGEAHE